MAFKFEQPEKWLDRMFRKKASARCSRRWKKKTFGRMMRRKYNRDPEALPVGKWSGYEW